MTALERDRRGDGSAARSGGRGLLSPPIAPVLALAMVVFDLDVGQLVEDVYPDGALSPEECRDIAFHAFPVRLRRPDWRVREPTRGPGLRPGRSGARPTPRPGGKKAPFRQPGPESEGSLGVGRDDPRRQGKRCVSFAWSRQEVTSGIS